jgi:hypothetical protein
MPLEDLTGASKFIDSLNSLNPDGATDTIDEGDDHLRGIKNVLKNTFPNITEAITATAALINGFDARLVVLEAVGLTPAAQNPIGTIKMTTQNVNPGTYIAGTTWAQIAQGRTLIGEGAGAGLTTRTAGTELGVEDAIVPQHTHTASQVAHSHTVNYDLSGSGSGAADNADGGSVDGNFNTGSATPAITVDQEGVDPTDGNMQPSLVCYIWERTA